MPPNSHTPFFSTEAFAALGAPDLVYVRPIKAAEILADAPEGVEDFDLAPDQTLYAVCRADGARLARAQHLQQYRARHGYRHWDWCRHQDQHWHRCSGGAAAAGGARPARAQCQ